MSLDLQYFVALTFKAALWCAMTILPVYKAVSERSLLSLVRGVLLASTAALLLLRSENTLTDVFRSLDTGLSLNFTAMMATCIVCLPWAALWSVIVPLMWERAKGASTWVWHGIWGLLMLASIWFSTMILAPLPGYMMHQTKAYRDASIQKTADYEAKLLKIRASNAAQVCSLLVPRLASNQTVSVKKKSGQPDLIPTIQSFELDPAKLDTQQKCTKEVASLDSKDQKLFIGKIVDTKATNPNHSGWQVEPEAPAQDVLNIKDVALAEYFVTAVTDISSHIKRVGAGSDLLTTFVLLGEAMVLFLMLLGGRSEKFAGEANPNTNESDSEEKKDEWD